MAVLTDCPTLLQVELREAPCPIHCIPLQPHSLRPPIAGVRMASYIPVSLRYSFNPKATHPFPSALSGCN